MWLYIVCTYIYIFVYDCCFETFDLFLFLWKGRMILEFFRLTFQLLRAEGWETAKKHWCCYKKGVACDPFNCEVGMMSNSGKMATTKRGYQSVSFSNLSSWYIYIHTDVSSDVTRCFVAFPSQKWLPPATGFAWRWVRHHLGAALKRAGAVRSTRKAASSSAPKVRLRWFHGGFRQEKWWEIHNVRLVRWWLDQLESPGNLQ